MKTFLRLLFLLTISLRCCAAVPLEAALQFFDDPPAVTGGAGDFVLTNFTFAGQDAGTDATSGPGDFTGAKLFVVSAARAGGSFGTFSDSKANTWTVVFSPVTNGNWPSNQMYYCINPVTDSAQTFTLAGGGSFAVEAFACSGTPVLNGQIQAGTTSATTFQPGTLTPSGTNLFVTGFAAINGAFDVDSFFASTQGGEVVFNGVDLWASIGYKNSATAENPTWGNLTTTSGTASMLMFGMSGGGGSGFTLIAPTGVVGTGNSGLPSTCPPIDTTGANLLVIAFNTAAGTPSVTAEIYANTWRAGTPITGAPPMGFLYCTNPTVGSGHTITINSTPFGGVSFQVFAFAKAGGPAAFDGQSAGGSLGSWSSTGQPGSFTPASANNVFISAVSFDVIAGSGISIDSGFTSLDSPKKNSTTGQGIWSAYKIKSSDSSAENPTFTNGEGGGPDAKFLTISFQ